MNVECYHNASVDFATVETGAQSLMAHMVNDLQLPDDYEYCLLNASLDL